MLNEVFPPSELELQEAKKAAESKMNFFEVLAPLNLPIQVCNNKQFTHRCPCPLHKSGAERTASFFFSEIKKDYFCFACQSRGSIVDIVSFLTGRPWFLLVQDELGQDYDYSVHTAEPIDFEFLTNVELELSTALRMHLCKYEGTPQYQAECQWVDSQFYHIDQRLAHLSAFKVQDIVGFKFQMMLEMQRRTN